ncbi:MAG: pyridoxal 5'-phosphate synthase glutaminase subunit PdxT [Syntrophus sp. (in: bacteria)]|nr:pyridoxal 5'-phosphate synthase glutaminase subunit PdxT [Syntrophus sp. (in: bacteria)]
MAVRNAPESLVKTEETIGVLDLQGSVFEHLEHLERIGVSCRPVKTPADILNLRGLIIPGGESTCLSRLMSIFGIADAIEAAFAQGMYIWGTCAGAILLASGVIGESSHLGLIDMDIERNSFGSQLDSFTATAIIPQISDDYLPLTFIRAPKIRRTGPGVAVLLTIDDYIAAAESDRVLVTVFHPELTGSVAFHRYFARKCGVSALDESRVPDVDPSWNRCSWMRVVPGLVR